MHHEKLEKTNNNIQWNQFKKHLNKVCKNGIILEIQHNDNN